MQDPEDLWTRAEDYADGVDERWRVLLLVVAGAEIVIAVWNLLRLQPPANLLVAGVQAVAAGLLVLAVWVLRGRRLTHRQSQPLIAAALVAFALVIPLEMALTRNGLLTANVGLTVVVAGTLLVETRWFVVAAASLTAAWALVIVARGPWDLPVERLVAFIGVAIVVAALVHALRVQGRARLVAALDEARTSALRDDLTGLWNRRGLRVAARPLLGAARTAGQPAWAVVLDVRGLKQVNDRGGHPTGDRVLLALGRALARREDTGEVVARWGGDEFVLVGLGLEPDLQLVLADALGTAIARGGAVDQPWGLDAGVASSDDLTGPTALDDLLAQADADLYLRRRRALGPAPGGIAPA